MNPKEKAAYLIVKYMSKVVSKNVAKECALVAVDEMYNIAHNLDDMTTVGYLIDVKNEIEKA